MLLCAGLGTRFRPVTEWIPKPLFPYLNVPLALAHLSALKRAGVSEAGVNLHHLADQVERSLTDRAADLPDVRFFREAEILGTAGALANAAEFLSREDFLLVNSDAALEPDYESLLARHRETGRAATLLVVPNLEPDRYTPLQAEGDRIARFGGDGNRALLYTGVCVLSPRLLALIPPGKRSLVADLWEPLLSAKREEIGWVLHEGPFSDLGRPSDFLRASLEALERGGPFPEGSGAFDPRRRVLSVEASPDRDFDLCVLGRARIGAGARLTESVVWEGSEIGAEARITRCLVAGGRIPRRARHENALLWARRGEPAVASPLS